MRVPWGKRRPADPIARQDFPEDVTSGWLYHGGGTGEEVGTRPPQIQKGAKNMIH